MRDFLALSRNAWLPVSFSSCEYILRSWSLRATRLCGNMDSFIGEVGDGYQKLIGCYFLDFHSQEILPASCPFLLVVDIFLWDNELELCSLETWWTARIAVWIAFLILL